jgi:tRNA threonylcarbamoyladenosine biosynthesis protein TsaB
MDDIVCLAVETATDRAGVALAVGERVLVREASGTRTPSRDVYLWAAELFQEAALRPGDLHCVIFGAGPGSFTGVRLAAAVAQALGFGARVPVVPVSSLAALARGALAHCDASVVLPCLDARMGEIYAGAYARSSDGVPSGLMPDSLLAPALFPSTDLGLALADYASVGPGWSAFPDLGSRCGAAVSATVRVELLALLPDVRHVLALGRAAFARGVAFPAAAAAPNYLRDKVTA